MKNFLNRQLNILLAAAFIFYSCKKSSDDITPPPANAVISTVAGPGGTASGAKNSIITITGTGFITDTSKIQVLINGHSCTVLTATETKITAKVPPKCGSGNLVLIINGKSYNGPAFTYIYSYTLSSVTNGQIGYQDGPVATEKFEEFVGITIDGNDNIYNAQYNKPRVRKISPSGDVSTMAGDGTIGHVNANGTNAKLGQHDIVSSDAAGNIYVADLGGYIRKVDVNKNVTDFYTFSSGIQPFAVKVMPSGNVYVTAYLTSTSSSAIGKITAAGNLTWLATSAGVGDVDGPVGTAKFNLYDGLEVSADETKIYVTDFSHGANAGNKVKMLYNNSITTIAGNSSLSDGNGPALSVGFKLLSNLLLDKDGGLYIADAFNGKIKYLKDGNVKTILGDAGKGDVDGDVSLAKIYYPHGLVFDSKGDLYISDASLMKLKKLTID